MEDLGTGCLQIKKNEMATSINFLGQFSINIQQQKRIWNSYNLNFSFALCLLWLRLGGDLLCCRAQWTENVFYARRWFESRFFF